MDQMVRGNERNDDDRELLLLSQSVMTEGLVHERPYSGSFLLGSTC